MVTISTIPAAAASATSVELLVELDERLCRPFNVNALLQPSAVVTFTAGTPYTLNGYAVAPITAVVTIVQPTGNNCARSQVFAETFDVAFTATDANTIALTPGTSVKVTPTSVKCCKTQSIKATATLGVAIS